MKYTTLGRSRVEVSSVCLGTMNMGRHLDDAASHELLDRALELGVNYFDTANRYGTPDRKHASEEILGSWFAGDPSRRDRVVLATKVFEPLSDRPNDGGLSALHIRRACEDSLRRLQTDHIDIYQMHHIDRRAPWDEIWEAMDLLRTQGKIVYVGSSNFAGWNLADAQHEARRRNSLGLITEQSVYSLANRAIEQEVLPAARAFGVGVVAWSPLAQGLLAGTADAAGRRASDPAHTERLRRHADALAGTAAIADELGTDMATVALAWVAAQPGVAAPIIGPRTIEQLERGAASVDLTLDAALLARLDALWPSPGEAPWSYAW